MCGEQAKARVEYEVALASQRDSEEELTEMRTVSQHRGRRGWGCEAEEWYVIGAFLLEASYKLMPLRPPPPRICFACSFEQVCFSLLLQFAGGTTPSPRITCWG